MENLSASYRLDAASDKLGARGRREYPIALRLSRVASDTRLYGESEAP